MQRNSLAVLGPRQLEAAGDIVSNPQVSGYLRAASLPPSCLQASPLQVLRQTSLQVGPWSLAQSQQRLPWRMQTKWKTPTELNKISILPPQQ